ncbi:MAG: DUF3017 domain-containing protein [Aeromicrobium sp.]|uniref:DUF3017 domain-containing protein n=1 Tax=Aeromicrobium sp. TaxID=1871063 RepID=UPI0039E4940E
MSTPLRAPRTLGTRAYVVLLALVVVGLALVGFGYWRKGIALVGGVFGLAAGVRLALPDEQAGLLAVRGRPFDVAWTASLSAALTVLALSVPGGD